MKCKSMRLCMVALKLSRTSIEYFYIRMEHTLKIDYKPNNYKQTVFWRAHSTPEWSNRLVKYEIYYLYKKIDMNGVHGKCNGFPDVRGQIKVTTLCFQVNRNIGWCCDRNLANWILKTKSISMRTQTHNHHLVSSNRFLTSWILFMRFTEASHELVALMNRF